MSKTHTVDLNLLFIYVYLLSSEGIAGHCHSPADGRETEDACVSRGWGGFPEREGRCVESVRAGGVYCRTAGLVTIRSGWYVRFGDQRGLLSRAPLSHAPLSRRGDDSRVHMPTG